MDIGFFGFDGRDCTKSLDMRLSLIITQFKTIDTYFVETLPSLVLREDQQTCAADTFAKIIHTGYSFSANEVRTDGAQRKA